MNLIRLVYASRFCESKFDAKELSSINQVSQKNNQSSEITGMLIFGDDYFLQCLEGDRQAVSKLFSKISLDPRHDSVVLLSVEEIVKRDFGEWKMKLVLLTEANRNLIKTFSASSEFNPFTMNSQSALEFMKALRS